MFQKALQAIRKKHNDIYISWDDMEFLPKISYESIILQFSMEESLVLYNALFRLPGTLQNDFSLKLRDKIRDAWGKINVSAIDNELWSALC